MSSVRSCLFCGARPVTSAHIVGRQFRARLPAIEGSMSYMSVEQLPDQLSPTTTMRSMNVHPFEMQVRSMCAPCNRDWMGGIELDCVDAVTAMARGEAVQLNASARERIATWVAIIVMLRARQDVGYSVFEAEDYELVRKTSLPLPGDFVWVASMHDATIATSRHLRIATDGLTAHVSYMRLGRVAFVECSSVLAGLMLPRMSMLGSAAEVLYPSKASFDWPPPKRQVTEEMLRVATDLAG